MPRRTSAIKIWQFLGEVDETPATIGDSQASVFENWYRRRNIIYRRKGYSPLASALSPDTEIRGLEWVRINETEHLLSVNSGDIRDWLHATPGTVVAGGTDIFPSSGSADVNGALIEDILYLGNGIDGNVRFNAADPGLAADMVVATTQGLRVVNGANALFQDPDISVLATFYLDSIALNATDTGVVGRQAIVSIWDRSTASGRSFRLAHNPNTNRFLFQVRGTTGTETEVECTSVTPAVGTWYTAIGRHDDVGNTISIQVNGGTVHSTAHSDGLNLPANVDLHVGSMFNGSGVAAGVLDGRVGPVGIWRSAAGSGGHVSDAVALSLYRAVPLREADLTVAQESDLIAFWDMGEASGTRDDDHNAGTTFNLLEFGGTTGSAAGPFGANAALVISTGQADDIAGPDTLNSGQLPPSIYSYVVTNVNSDGVRSQESAVAFEVDTTAFAPRRINVAGIPLGPSGTAARELWRTDSASTVYKLVTTLDDNTTTSYDDNELIDLNETLVEGNVEMPPLGISCEFNGRWVGAGNAEDPNTLFISNKFEPYYCPAAPDLENPLHGSRDRLQGKAGGRITGVHAHGSVVAVFTAGAGYFLTGDQPLDFAVNKFCDHGCTAHRTVRSARDLLIWLGPDAVWAFDGRSVFSISEDQRVTVEAMTAAEKAGAWSMVWRDKYFLCWATGCIVFDLQYKQWSTNTNWLWRQGVVTEFAGSNGERIYAAQEGHARVFQLETGATDNGTAIPARLATKDLDLNAAGREKRAHYVEVRAKKSTGTLALVLKKGTGQTVQAETHNLAAVEDANETVTRIMMSCREEARSEFFRIELSSSTAAADLEILMLQLEYMVAQ